MAARALRPNADHSTTLTRGRFYRLVLIVNGEPGETELRAAVLSWGFDTGAAISWPGTWAADKPRDWPAETIPPDLAANEFPVRVSGSFVGPTRTIGADTPVSREGAEGALTIWQGWDMAPASTEALEAREKEREPEESPEETKTRTRVLWVAGGLLTAGLVWKFAGSRSSMAKEQGEYEKLERRANQARRAGRIRELLGGGHDPEGAKAIAEHEDWMRSRELEHESRHGEEG
jgi:hypothetical protein